MNTLKIITTLVSSVITWLSTIVMVGLTEKAGYPRIALIILFAAFFTISPAISNIDKWIKEKT